MRILLVHNFYQSSAPSGEDSVFRNELLLLERAGHEVITYTRANDEIGSGAASRLGAARDAVWSPRTRNELEALVRAHRPQVAHFHNTFPLVSPSGWAACRDLGVPVVQTLHNYRLICPGAMLVRDGQSCEDCVGRVPVGGIVHGCYRGSRGASALVAGMLVAHRAAGSYRQAVDRYLCLTAFARERLVRGGLPPERVFVKPNTLPEPPTPGDGSGGHALFVGRLTREKGVHTLIEAWRGVPMTLHVVGDGALRGELEQQARDSRSDVRFLGFLPQQAVYAQLQAARLLVIPSECYEGFPVTVLEGLASGTPMLVSRIGALDELLEDGRDCRKFTPGNPDSLRATLLSMVADEEALVAMRGRCRATFDERYAPESVLSELVAHYAAVQQ